MNVAQFKSEITPKLHGTSLAKIAGVNGKLREAASNMLSRCKPPTLKRAASIAPAIYDHVYNYAVEDDLMPGSVIDIRPVSQRSKKDDIGGRFGKEFDIRKEQDTFEIETINGVRTLRLSKVIDPSVVLAHMDHLTLNGTITGSGDVQNLHIDNLDFIAGFGSVRFDLDGNTGEGIIEVALPYSVDISRFERYGAAFEWLKFPSNTLVSVRLRLGSSPSDYYETTVSAAHDRPFTAIAHAWALIRHMQEGAVATGSPDFSQVRYIQIALDYPSGTPLTGVKLDNITAALGQAFEVVYYSDRMFRGTNGERKAVPTDDTDEIMLNQDGLNILIYEFMLTLQQEMKGKDMGTDFAYFREQLNGSNKYVGLYESFNRTYPSEALTRQQSYYDFGQLDGHGN